MRALLPLVFLAAACHGCEPGRPATVDPSAPHLPLVEVAEYPLPGASSRFDYQDLDRELGQLVIAHMNAGSVLVVNVRDGSVKAELPGIPTPRGVVVAPEVDRIFVTSTPSTVVIIDRRALTEVARVATGTAPDGVAWDPGHRVVGVSDQGDGALSLIADAGRGTRVQVPLGRETGNVAYDTGRGWFWITVVPTAGPDQLVAVDPVAATVQATIALPGCSGAHGLRLHPDGTSAFIACEDNDRLARVELQGAHALALGDTGANPDVLSLDPALGWLYVAAESGDLTVFDLRQPGVALIGHDAPGEASHSVAADPTTHRVYFPLLHGKTGAPALRVLRPGGSP